ncbi:hypothetical protein EV207_10581 [Scopulibacillus darangshiensis]|uniref:Uncharacterized protein n=1 Tax=Scopulibacillus darangshiensis TaxID=442528 RepID=A0A4R2P6R7_9BACL|nr:hypothetical protein [Scopulibacillus darangshiensis]TCP30552.1 hypothetical protein EV207_10581 [Scopulibacillus darangshiensis]
MVRYTVMERQWVAGQMQLIIMDWRDAKIITLTLDDLEDPSADPALKEFLDDNIGKLKGACWRDSL